MTYGYITKSRRIRNNIEKSHHSDAYCIAGNLKAERLESCMIIKLLPRHTRALHVCNPKKCGKRRSTIAPHLIGKTNLQRFDTVIWNGIDCFIFGSSGGRLVLRDINGKLVSPTPTVNSKSVKYMRHKSHGMIAQYINNITTSNLFEENNG